MRNPTPTDVGRSADAAQARDRPLGSKLVVRRPAPGYLPDVDQFIDVSGASGATYRFQRVSDPARLPATAGNFIFIRSGPDGDTLVCCGTAHSLALAKSSWKAAVAAHQATDIFVRLNVSRATRASEHEDIVERQNPIIAVVDPG